jgi:hypothetical protein
MSSCLATTSSLPNPLCRWLQNRETCFALVMFADVVSIGPRVICQHDSSSCSGIIWVYLVLLGKTDMFVPVELFNCLIECRTQAVGHIVAALGKPNGWLALLCLGGIDCHTLCIVGVALGNGSAFVLGTSDAVVEEQIITLT